MIPFKLRRALIALFLLLSGAFANAQDDETITIDTSKLTPKKSLALADNCYATARYANAAIFYRKYLTKIPDDPHGLFGLAASLLLARDYKGSEQAFKSFYASNGAADPTYVIGHFYYGTILQRLGKYTQAKTEFRQFQMEYTGKDLFFPTIVKNLIASCDSASLIPSRKILIAHLPSEINTKYAEKAPAILAQNELYYTSTARDSGKYLGEQDELYSNIYRNANKKEKWGNPQMVNPTVHERDMFNCYGTFNQAGTRYYFTHCIEQADSTTLCNLYYCPVENGIFGTAKRLPDNVNNAKGFSSAQPTVRSTENLNEEYIYFISNRQGGAGGGMDIWYTFRTGEKYTDPVPLKGINTIGDEQSPYWDATTKTLYFSSNGRIGFGGYDIYQTQQNSEDNMNEWAAPENLGKPVNSGADDLFYTASADGSFGYFSSNRDGAVLLNGIASDDIFKWEHKYHIIRGKVSRQGTGEALDAVCRLYRKNPDGRRDLLTIDSTTKTKNYSFKLYEGEEYTIEVSKPAFTTETAIIFADDLKDDTAQQNFELGKESYVVEGELMDEEKEAVNVYGSATILLYEVLDDGKTRLISETPVSVKSYQYSIKVPENKTLKIEVRKEGWRAGYATVSTKNPEAGTEIIRADLKLRKMKLKGE